MSLYKNKYRIESARLQNWDYSSPAYYFVTICLHNRECIFGNVENDNMILNDYGKIVYNEWLHTYQIRPELEPDKFVVMPNHFHCIAHITGDKKIIDPPTQSITNNIPPVETPCYGVSGYSKPQQYHKPKTPCHGVSTKPNSQNHWKSGVLGAIMGQFKIQVTKQIRRNGYPNFKWQFRFHDHIIRNEKELFRIRQYIQNNPANWNKDRFNAQCINCTKEDNNDYEQELWMI